MPSNNGPVTIIDNAVCVEGGRAARAEGLEQTFESLGFVKGMLFKSRRWQ